MILYFVCLLALISLSFFTVCNVAVILKLYKGYFFAWLCAHQKVRTHAWSTGIPRGNYWKLGIRITAWQKPCIESLGKISAKINQCKLFRNGLVHKFYHLKALITLEQVITSEAERKKNLNVKLWWWCSLVGCCKLSLYAKVLCWACSLLFAMIEITQRDYPFSALFSRT